MKFKGWLGASLVLLTALAASIFLLYYWESVNNASLQSLQTRINEIELERVVERGGQQLFKQTRQSAEKIESLFSGMQSEVEALADHKDFRTANNTSRQADLIRQKMSANKSWYEVIITDTQGSIITTIGGSKAASSIIDKERFNFSKIQRLTTVAFNKKNDTASLDIMVPCLSENSVFLGMIQVSVLLSGPQIKKTSGQSNVIILFGDQSGNIYFSSNQEISSRNLESMIGKQKESVSEILEKGEQHYFRARWESKNYIIAAVPLSIKNLFVYGMIPASGLEKAIAPQSGISNVFSDPIIVGGYVVIILVGILLMVFVSSGSQEGITKINSLLSEMLNDNGQLKSVRMPLKGEMAKLLDYINFLIERTQQTPVDNNNSSTDADMAELQARHQEAIKQLQNEITRLQENLNHAQQTTQVANKDQNNQLQSMQHQIDELNRKNLQLNQSLTETAQKLEEANARQESSAVSEEDLEMLERIRQAGTLRIEAITTMSNDLKATLMVIKNYISAILYSEEGKITDAQQEFLGDVINKSARLERQINDLLDISHMESEGTGWYSTATDLVAMLQDVVLNIQPQADTKQIRILPEIQSHLPMVKINSDRMGQVFINLVQHALKITPVGGEVRITATETLSDIVIKIRDGGTPLSQQQAVHVFSSYNGEDAKAGSDYVSTGLRFAIIHEIIQLHHGTIAMRGLPDRGNEAVISLPKSKVITDESFASTMAFSATTMKETPLSENVSEGVSKTDMPPEEVEQPEVINPMDAYEVKAVDEDSTTSPYDLSAFMGKMDDTGQGSDIKVPGVSEDLDDLLKDIENIDGQMDK